jgi:hypothetical protein
MLLHLRVLLIGIGTLLAFTGSATADSWLTSTRFYQAYLDVPQVKRAAYTGFLDGEDASFISDRSKPLGVKAAMINAYYLSTNNSFFGNVTDSNYEALVRHLKKKYGTLRSKKISSDEHACLGYLQALEEYKSPRRALKHFKRARRKNWASLMSQVLSAMTTGQDSRKKGLAALKKAFSDKTLTLDVRREALEIIARSTRSALPAVTVQRDARFLPPVNALATGAPGNAKMLAKIYTGHVRERCSSFTSPNKKRLSLCFEIRPEPNHRRKLFLTLRDPSKLNRVKNHQILSRWKFQNDIKSDEAVYHTELHLLELRDNFYLLWFPVYRGVANNYDEAYTLLYFFDATKDTGPVPINLKLTCPSGCTSQFVNHQSMGGKTTVFYSTKVNGKRRKKKFDFDGRKLKPL